MAEAKKTPAQMAAEGEIKTEVPGIVVEEIKEEVKPKRVKIMIPEDVLNPGNKQWWCCINGQQYYVQRGKTVEVDDAVADLYHTTVQREQENRGKIKVTAIGQG